MDPKRLEVSKRSRLSYLLENKKNNIGEELSKEEQMILYNYYDNMKRFRNLNNNSNKSNSISNANNSKIESKSVSSKSRIHLKNEINDAMGNNRLFTVDFSKKRLPKSENHTSLYVRNYLKYSNLKSNNLINTIKTYKPKTVNNINIIDAKKERIIEDDVKYNENLNYQEELLKDFLTKDVYAFSKIKNEEIIKQQEKKKTNHKIEDIRKELIRENEDKSFLENEITNMLDKNNFDFQLLNKKCNIENLNNSNVGNNKEVSNNIIVGTNSNNITKNKFNNSKYSSNSKDKNNNFNNNANVSTSIKVNNNGTSNIVNTFDDTKFLPEHERVSKLFEFISKARKSNVSFEIQERLYINFLSQMNLYLNKLLDYYNENTNYNNTKKNNDDIIKYVNSCFNSISNLKIDSNRFGFLKGKKTSNVVDEKIKKLNNLLKCQNGLNLIKY